MLRKNEGAVLAREKAARKAAGEMDDYTACGLAEGFIEADSEEQVIAAWQHLIDTGLCWRLQGWYGRTASDLIERGICTRKDTRRVEIPASGTFF